MRTAYTVLYIYTKKKYYWSILLHTVQNTIVNAVSIKVSLFSVTL